MESLPYLIKAAIVLALFYGTYALFLSRETFFHINRHFLLIGVLLSFCLPSLEFTKTIVVEIPQPLNPIYTSTGMDATPPISSAVAQVPFYAYVNLEIILWTLYLLGVLIGIIRFMSRLNSLQKLIKSNPAKPYKSYKLIETKLATAPFSFFNYVVFNPVLHTQEELEMILKHEEIHMRQKHSIDMIVGNLLIIVQWFNPFAWIYRKSMEENLEFIADRGTIQKILSKKEYQLTLVRASSAVLAPALTNHFYQSFIKKRIIMLNKSHSNKRNAIKIGLVLPFIALFLYGFNVKEIVTYVEIPGNYEETKLPKDADITPESLTINIPNETNGFESVEPVSVLAEKEAEASSVNYKLSENDFKVLITKNTTEGELQKIKDDLKKNHNLELTYVTSRNKAGEITSISMSYSGNENSGNYQVMDDDGINDFYFYVNDNGKTGFWSEESEAQHNERNAAHRERLEERRAEMEARRAELEAQRTETEENRDEMHHRMEVREMEMHERQKALDLQEEDRARRVVRLHDPGKEHVYVFEGSGHHPSDDRFASTGIFTIHRLTTDSELAKLKERLASKNIDFNYRNVKRNDKGEISGLKFTLTEPNGSKSSTVVKSDGDNPIDEIIIKQ